MPMEERVRGRNEKRMVAKLSSLVCQLPLTTQKWPIMFNILSLSGGRKKEQRSRVGRLEESSVANSIVNIIPYHLLPVKAQAKFVLCCTHGTPVAKNRKTLSGQHEPCRVRSHKTEPTIMPTAQFKYKSTILKSVMCSSVLGRTAEQQRVKKSVCVKSTHIRKISGFTRRAIEGEWKSGRIHCGLTGPTNVNHHEEDDANQQTELMAKGDVVDGG